MTLISILSRAALCACLAILTVCETAYAGVETPRGIGGSGSAFGLEAPAPPVLRRGFYEVSGENPIGILSNDDLIVLVTNRSITAYDKPEETMTPEDIEGQPPLWERILPAPTQTEVAGFTVNPSLVGDELLVIEHTIILEVTGGFDFEVRSEYELLNLNVATGEENFSVIVEKPDEEVIAVQNTRVTTGPNGFYLIDEEENFWRLDRYSREDGSIVETVGFDYVPNDIYNGKAGFVSYDLMVTQQNKIHAFSSNNLSNIFEFDFQDEDLPPIDGTQSGVADLVFSPDPDNRAIFAIRDSRLVALDRTLQPLWIKDFEQEGDCSNPTGLATDGEVLLVAGHCTDDVFLLDAQTGEEIWSHELSELSNFSGKPFVTGSAVYYHTLGFDVDRGGFGGLLNGFDRASGDQLVRINQIGNAVPALISGDDDFLYTYFIGAPNIQDGSTLLTLEAAPADLSISVSTNALGECPPPETEPLVFPVTIRNDGPGLARSPRLRVYNTGVRGVVELRDDNGVLLCDNISGYLDCTLPDLPAMESRSYEVIMTPAGSGDLSLSFNLNADTRDIDSLAAASDEERDTFFEATVRVIPAPTPADFLIENIEVTQVIQDLNNTIPLIAGKATLVRVYPRSDALIGLVSCELASIGADVIPLNNCLQVPDTRADRSVLNSSFNFLIPTPPEGEVSFTAILDPDGILPDTDTGNNTFTRSVTFQSVPGICLETYRVRTEDLSGNDNYTPPRILQRDYLARTLGMLPTAEIRVIPNSDILERERALGLLPGPFNLDPERFVIQNLNIGRLWIKLWWRRLAPQDPSCNGLHRLYVGMVGEDMLTTAPDDDGDGQPDAFFNGIARFRRPTNLFRVRGTSIPGVFQAPSGAVTLAHEIGHNFRRRHIDCGNPALVDNDYPYDPCILAPRLWNGFYGIDLAYAPDFIPVLQPQAPGMDSASSLSDLLSYAGNRWPSDYTYNAMLDYLVDNTKENKQVEELKELERLKQGGNVILAAVIAPEGNATEFGSVATLPMADVSEEAAKEMIRDKVVLRGKQGAGEVRLLDGSGAVIESAPLELEEFADDGQGLRAAAAILSANPNAAAIEFSEPGLAQPLRLERSANAPEAVIQSPSNGEIVEGDFQVEWTVSDQDGDEPLTTVQYSHDAGASWRTIAANTPATSRTIDSSLLPGTDEREGRIRLIVSDGLNTTIGLSDPFTVPKRSPFVSISRPESGETFPFGNAVQLRGDGYDPEDGPLAEEALQWTSSLDGSLGQGPELFTQELSIGTHTITLTGTDLDGNESTAVTELTIQAPPVILPTGADYWMLR